MKKLIKLSFLMALLSFSIKANAQGIYISPKIHYTSTGITVYSINQSCYGAPGVRLFVNNQQITVNPGFCAFGICQFTFPFGTLQVGDQLKAVDGCGNASIPVTILDDQVYVEVAAGGGQAGNGISNSYEGLPYTILNTPINVGKCSPIDINAHALHRVGVLLSTGNNSGTFTSGIFKINGASISGLMTADNLNNPSNTSTINANGSVSYSGSSYFTSNDKYSGRTPFSFEYDHNGVLPFWDQEITVGPLGYRIWSHSRIEVKEYKYDGTVIATDINGSYAASKFKITFDAGSFKFYIDDVLKKTVNRTVVYNTSSGTISNTSELPYGTGVSWTPANSGAQWVGAYIDGVRYTRQQFNVAADLSINPIVTNVACNGGNTGSINANVSGGLAPLSYSFDGGTTYGSNSVLGGLSASTNSIKVRDASVCEATRTGIVVSSNPLLEASISSFSNATCAGTSNGAVTVSASGGTGTYQYSADGSNYSSNNNFTGLSAGNYTFSVKDAAGCIKTVSQTIATQSTLASSATSTAISCFGGNNGSISISTSGTASGAIQYTINGGTSFATASSNPIIISNLSYQAGGYAVFVKDNVCSSASQNVIINQPTDIGISLTASNITCFGLTNGQVVVNASGGTPAGTAPAYLYSIISPTAGFGANNTFTGLGVNNYKFWVKDGNGCVKESAIQAITQPTDISLSVTSKTDAICFGGTGTVNLSASGGTGTIEYSKDGTNFQSSSSFSRLRAGTYTFTAKDGNSCLKTINVQILEPSIIIINNTISSQISCFGGDNGVVTVGASGGTGALTYAIGTGAFSSTNVFDTLAAGSYIFNVKDANGCIISKNETINQPTVISPTIASQTNISCFGGNNGAITIAASGGTGAYSYSKDGVNFQGNGNFTGFAIGTVTFSVKDANGCIIPKATTFTQPTDLMVIALISKQVDCFGGADGIIQVNVISNSGTAPYEYSKDGSIYESNNGTFSGLPIGTYGFWVKDANGCIKTTNSSTIIQPALLVPSVVNVIDASCFGGNDGVVKLTATGGTRAFAYKNGNNAYQSDSVFTGLSSGTYTFTIRDAKGCEKTITATVNQPAAAFTMSLASSTNLTCYQQNIGQITVNATGGTSPYQYSIDNLNFQSGTSFPNLAAGTYAIYGRDAKNCLFNVANTTLTQPTDIVVSLLRKEDINCEYATKGEFLVGATGSNGGFSYALSGTDFKNNPIAPQNNATGLFQNLAAGNFIINATDNRGCVKPFPVTLIPKNSGIRFDVAKTLPTTCLATDGNITVNNVTGGNPAYTYRISTQAGFSSSNSFSSLGSGNYFITVADNLCSYTQNVDLLAPNSIQATYTISPISCTIPNANFTIDNITGGNGNYQIAPDGINYSANRSFTNLAPNLYAFTIQDSPLSCRTTLSVEIKEQNRADLQPSVITNIACFAANTGFVRVIGANNMGPFTFAINNPNGSYGSSGDFGGLPAGNYRFYAKNRIGCIDSIRVVLTQPTQLTSSLSQSDNLCFGDVSGNFTLTASGGVSPYQYSKDNASYQAINVFNSLTAGNYTAYVKDANGCVLPKNLTLSQPTDLQTSISISNQVSCFAGSDASILVGGSGGTSPYRFSADAVNYVNSGVFANLPINTYSYKVKDAHGCIKTTSNVTVTQPPLLVPSVDLISNVKCYNGKDGEVTLSTIGGTPPIQYSANQVLYQNASKLTQFIAGTFTLSVKDSKGCIKTIPATLTQPAPLIASTTVTKQVSCYLGADGIIEVSNNGGTAPFQYSKDSINYVSSNIFTNLISNQHKFWTKDANSCVQVTNYAVVTQPTLLEPSSINQVNVSCFGLKDAKIDIVAIGGTPPYLYQEGTKDFRTDPQYRAYPKGIYTFSVKDAKGCVKEIQRTITQPDSLILIPIYADTISCNGLKDGRVKLNYAGGTYEYFFSLDKQNYQSSNEFKDLKAGKYQFYIKDKNLCANKADLELTEPDLLVLSLVSQKDPLCNGETNGIVSIKAKGGNSGNVFSMDNFRKNRSGYFDSLTKSTYFFDVKDRKGCKDTIAKVSLVWPKSLETEAITKLPVCFGDKNASIKLAIKGGQKPYYSYSKDLEKSENDLINLQKDTLKTDSTALYQQLKSGNYSFLIKDANGCQQYISQTITDAKAIKPIDFSELPKDVCKGQEVVLTSNNEENDLIKTWYLNDKPISNFVFLKEDNPILSDNGNTLTTSQTGIYKLRLKNQTGCEVSQIYQLKNNPNALKADFLMPTQAFIGDTIVALDITKPLPTEVFWYVPNTVYKISTQKDKIVFIPNEEGINKVSMVAKIQGCENIVRREMKIFRKEKISETGIEYQYKNKLLNDLSIFPNPNYGDFNLKVKFNPGIYNNLLLKDILPTTRSLVVQIVKISTGESVLYDVIKEKVDFNSEFTKNYTLNLQGGIYSLSIEINNERITKNIAILN